MCKFRTMGNVLYTGLCACSLLASLVLGQIAPLSNGTSPYLTRLPAFEQKPRVFILSDILNEVDDSQSLVRYLLYSNEFDTQGICATTSEWLPNATYPDAMKEIIDAYGSVVDNLNQHVNTNAQYKNASVLTSLVTSGPTVSRDGPQPPNSTRRRLTHLNPRYMEKQPSPKPQAKAPSKSSKASKPAPSRSGSSPGVV